MNTSKYFFQAFVVTVLAAVSFIGFKSVLPKKIFSETTTSSKNMVVDSLLLDALNDADALVTNDTIVNEKIHFTKVDGIQFPTETFEDFKGFQYLVPFYEKLVQLETEQKGKVRIAYFGDSMTDGDMIVQDFRTLFQQKFGGKGVGFVNITSESAASRSSLVHEFSPNWKTQSYLKIKSPSHPFGVNGHVFYANDTVNSAWVKFKANKIRFATELNEPTLFYGRSKNKNGKIKAVIGTDTISKKLNPNQKLNVLKIVDANPAAMKVYFKQTDSIPIYGFNFDDGKGVHVDNFSSRGNSGLPLSAFNVDLMHDFQEELGYDLIILHYGTNVLNYGSLNYSWYEKRMKKTVEHLKACFPGVTILVVSTADKATKYDLEMKTDSAVVPLTTAQKRYAIASESGFVNLFTLMGGDGSMMQWVEETPAKANKDYTHFNFRGAKEVANMLYNQINDGYQQYKVLRSKRKIKPKVTAKKDSVSFTKDSVHEE
jgi:lysophospholipase L1-like esterase